MSNQKFCELAIEAVFNTLSMDHKYTTTYGEITKDDIYIVWLTKVLGNNKALLSTTKDGDGIYVEVTYNGSSDELYVDTYKKQSNSCIKEIK